MRIFVHRTYLDAGVSSDCSFVNDLSYSVERCVMASMENLHNLGLPKRHGEPKPKTQRTIKNVITELVHKFGNYPTSQITEIYNAVLANLDRDIQLRVVSGEEQEVALKSLEALKGAGTSLGKDVRAII